MHPVSTVFEATFLSLQTVVVVFLLFHDWVKLGRLNNLATIRSQDTLQHRIFVTLLPGLPTAIGLFYSVRYFGQGYPHGLEMLLWITYGVLLVGLLRAWWIPYLLVADPKRAGALSGHFRRHALLPASAKWAGSGHIAYCVSPGDRCHRGPTLPQGSIVSFAGPPTYGQNADVAHHQLLGRLVA